MSIPFGDDKEIVSDIIKDIFRLLPCKYNKETDRLMLDEKGGLLEFKDTLGKVMRLM